MIRGWAIAVLAAGCGRVGFDRATPDGSGDVANIEDAPGSLIDDVFTAGETTSLVIDRGAVGSYYDATGTMVFAGPAEPRFDHDPITHQPLGLLLEPTAFNETHLSEQLDDGVEWFSNGAMSVTPDVALAPDNAMTADALVDADTGTQCRRAQSYIVPNDARTYTCSAFVKAGTSSEMTFGCELLGGTTQLQTGIGVDLDAGIVTDAPVGTAGYGLEPVGQGWFRVWIALQNNSTGNAAAALSFWSRIGNNATTGTYYGWGAQLEANDRPTSYIPNPTTVRTLRPLDTSRLFIPPLMIASGSVRVVARPAYDTLTAAACLITSGSQRICVMRDAAADQLSIDMVETTTVRFPHGPWPLGTSRWGAFTYDSANVESVSDDGSMGASSILPNPPSQITLGNDMVSSGIVHLERVTVWTTRITAAELSALSP